jgi:phospholipid/cholesterol/gamma-HCH transport system permease protein
MATAASLTGTSQGGWLQLAAAGRWDISAAGRLDAELKRLASRPGQPVRIDLSGLEALDTAGAWLIYRTLKRLKADNVAVEMSGLKPDHRLLLERVAASDRPAPIEPPAINIMRRLMEEVGEGTLQAFREGRELLAFVGLTTATLGRTLCRPARLRFTALVFHMEQVGVNALPIVGLISFLVGVVLAYQGAAQLQKFGAEIFVVNLIGVSVLREIGILLTAIVVAGRSGSAFTAQIGAMKVREEVDAMRTLGLDPIEVLVLPRILALVLTLPLLGFFADLMGLLGGGLMAWVSLDISPQLYLERLRDSIGAWHFWVGIIKAPAFAALIGLVGCFEGLRVEGSAESLGNLTTRSVVEAIFLVIVADAAFSIFFNMVGV